VRQATAVTRPIWSTLAGLGKDILHPRNHAWIIDRDETINIDLPMWWHYGASLVIEVQLSLV
jgi:hypothetical protein